MEAEEGFTLATNIAKNAGLTFDMCEEIAACLVFAPHLSPLAIRLQKSGSFSAAFARQILKKNERYDPRWEKLFRFIEIVVEEAQKQLDMEAAEAMGGMLV